MVAVSFVIPATECILVEGTFPWNENRDPGFRILFWILHFWKEPDLHSTSQSVTFGQIGLLFSHLNL